MNSIYSLLVGVPKYRNKDIIDLPMCSNDVISLRNILVSRLGQTTDNITLLGDKSDVEVTRSEILRAIRYVSKVVKDYDTLLFYFSGHGTAKNKQGYLVASDTELDLPADTSIPIPRVIDEFKSLESKNKLLLLDSCYSGVQLSKGMANIFSDFEEELGDLLSNGWTVLTSCQGDELSYFYEDKKLSVFTHFLIEGLNGTAGYNSGNRLSIDELYNFTFKKTAKWALESGKSQTPSLKTDRVGTILFTLSGENIAKPEPIDLHPSAVTEGEKEFMLSFKHTSPQSRTIDRIFLHNPLGISLTGYPASDQKELANRYEIIEYTSEQRMNNKERDRQDFYETFWGNYINHFSPSDIMQINDHAFNFPFGSIMDISIDDYSYMVLLKIHNDKIDDRILSFLKTIDVQKDHEWESIEYSFDGYFDFDAVRSLVLERGYVIKKFDIFSKVLSVEIPSTGKTYLKMSFLNDSEKVKIAISSYGKLPKEFFDILPVKELIAQFHETIKKN